MSDIHAADLHKMVRSWLLAEDPYGVNQRIEPTFDTAQPAMATPPAATAPPAPPPDTRGPTAGPDAVAKQLFGGQGARYSEAERDPRAQAQGEQAVARSTAPSPTAEVDRTRGQAWGENAVDKALNPSTGSGAGFWMPGEAAETASAVGEQAVAGSLASKARSKMARGRLKDPIDPDDRQAE
jgi:hypothetical protein